MGRITVNGKPHCSSSPGSRRKAVGRHKEEAGGQHAARLCSKGPGEAGEGPWSSPDEEAASVWTLPSLLSSLTLHLWVSVSHPHCVPGLLRVGRGDSPFLNELFEACSPQGAPGQPEALPPPS